MEYHALLGAQWICQLGMTLCWRVVACCLSVGPTVCGAASAVGGGDYARVLETSICIPQLVSAWSIAGCEVFMYVDFLGQGFSCRSTCASPAHSMRRYAVPCHAVQRRAVLCAMRLICSSVRPLRVCCLLTVRPLCASAAAPSPSVAWCASARDRHASVYVCLLSRFCSVVCKLVRTWSAFIYLSVPLQDHNSTQSMKPIIQDYIDVGLVNYTYVEVRGARSSWAERFGLLVLITLAVARAAMQPCRASLLRILQGT
jgi:hypothetical protein